MTIRSLIQHLSFLQNLTSTHARIASQTKPGQSTILILKQCLKLLRWGKCNHHLQCFFITLYSMQYFLWLVNKMVRTCKAWLCTWYAKEHQMRVQVLPKHKLLVKQMSSWHLGKSPYCCNWKENVEYIMNCKDIHIGYPVVVHQFMLKKLVLLYHNTNFHMEMSSLVSIPT